MLKFILRLCGLTTETSNKITPKKLSLVTDQPHFKNPKVAWVLGP